MASTEMNGAMPPAKWRQCPRDRNTTKSIRNKTNDYTYLIDINAKPRMRMHVAAESDLNVLE